MNVSSQRDDVSLPRVKLITKQKQGSNIGLKTRESAKTEHTNYMFRFVQQYSESRFQQEVADLCDICLDDWREMQRNSSKVAADVLLILMMNLTERMPDLLLYAFINNPECESDLERAEVAEEASAIIGSAGKTLDGLTHGVETSTARELDAAVGYSISMISSLYALLEALLSQIKKIEDAEEDFVQASQSEEGEIRVRVQ